MSETFLLAQCSNEGLLFAASFLGGVLGAGLSLAVILAVQHVERRKRRAENHRKIIAALQKHLSERPGNTRNWEN